MEANEEIIRKLNKRLSAKQLDIMISYLEADENLSTGKLSPLMNKADRKRKWKELADVLNAEGTAIKTPDQWRKCWSDQKGYAKHKAIKIRNSETEALTPSEERILKLIGMPQLVEQQQQQPTIVNVSSVHKPTADIIEDTLEIEESVKAIEVKQEMFSNETTNVIQEATPSEVSSPAASSSSRPSLPEKEKSPSVAINLQRPSSPLEVPASQISSEPGLSSGPSIPVTSQPTFVTLNLPQPSYSLGACQPGFVPIILNPIQPEKTEKPPLSKDLSEVNETLKQQLNVLTRIAEANEQIAHACMIIANKTEERTKELTLQNELIQDINHTLQHVLKKQKTNGDGDFF